MKVKRDDKLSLLGLCVTKPNIESGCFGSHVLWFRSLSRISPELSDRLKLNMIHALLF